MTLLRLQLCLQFLLLCLQLAYLLHQLPTAGTRVLQHGVYLRPQRLELLSERTYLLLLLGCLRPRLPQLALEINILLFKDLYLILKPPDCLLALLVFQLEGLDVDYVGL